MDGLSLGQKRKRILILCGNDAAGITAANVYADRLCEHDLCFLEERIISPERIVSFARKRIRRRGVCSLLGSLLYYGLRLALPAAKPAKRYLPKLVSNNFSADPAVAAHIRTFRPDAVLVGFCGLLHPDFLQQLPDKIYNIHPGINPRYRGFGNIWALYENNTACLGYTIHKVDAGTDTGEPVAIVRLDPQQLAGVRFADIDIPVAEQAARHLAGLLTGRAQGSVPEEFRNLPSQVYGVPTFSVFWRARSQFRRALYSSPQTILITGASSGLGKNLAQEFAAPGVHLVLWARHAGRLEDTAALCRAKGAATTVVCRDLRDLEQSRALLDDLDSRHNFDLAVFGAGVTSGTLPDGSPEPVRDACRTMTVNATAAVNTAGRMCELMGARGKGHIAVISSIAALYPLPDSPAYSAAKIALAYYAKGIRSLYPAVRISVIYPGYVDTPMSRRLAGPQPMRWSTEKAAAYMGAKLRSGATGIVFPRLLAVGMLLLHCMPQAAADFFLSRFAFSVVPDTTQDTGNTSGKSPAGEMHD